METQENKIYVGNLEFSVTEDELKKFIEEKGLVAKTVTIIKDKFSGRSKGFGFVEMDSKDAVEKAIDALNDQDLKGRKVRVSKARNPKEGGNRRP